MIRTNLAGTDSLLTQMVVPPGLIRLSAPLESDNIVNGPGLRTVIWTQGCHMGCRGCQNPETWDVSGGTMYPIAMIKNFLMHLKGQNGLTFCGGEPLLQSEACLEITHWVKRRLEWSVWAFTGFEYEDLPREGIVWDFVRELDVLIDGPFIESQQDSSCKWRGSRNQRILYLHDGQIMALEE